MHSQRIERAEGLSARVYREIERMILAGDLEPGSRLNEYALAEQFAVSRGPVREATRALVEAGLLVSVPSRGVFVREMSEAEIGENYDVRALLTGLMCARAAELRSDADVAALEGFVAAMDAAIAVGKVRDYYRINLDFHDRINAVSTHGCARRVYDDLIRETHSLRRALFSPGETNSEHRDMVAAIKAGDAEAARRLGEEHVLHGKRRWLASMSAATPRAATSPSKGGPR